jgi:hypothetical protein
LLGRLGGFDEGPQEVVADDFEGAFVPAGSDFLCEDARAGAAPFVELGYVFFGGFGA